VPVAPVVEQEPLQLDLNLLKGPSGQRRRDLPFQAWFNVLDSDGPGDSQAGLRAAGSAVHHDGGLHWGSRFPPVAACDVGQGGQ
jgi:hypothetical protein